MKLKYSLLLLALGFVFAPVGCGSEETIDITPEIQAQLDQEQEDFTNEMLEDYK